MQLQVVWQGAAAKPQGKRQKKGSSKTKQNKVAVVVVLGRCLCVFVALNTTVLLLLLCSSVEKSNLLALLFVYSYIHCYNPWSFC